METEGALEVQPVEGTEEYKFKVCLRELRGHCQIEYDWTSPFRPRYSKVALYEGNQTDPTKFKEWRWADCTGNAEALKMKTPWNTGQPWGSGYFAALIAQDCDLKTWKFVVKTPITTSN